MLCRHRRLAAFFFNDTATTEIYTLSLHDALPISALDPLNNPRNFIGTLRWDQDGNRRSEEHTSQLQSHLNLVCRLLLENKIQGHANDCVIAGAHERDQLANFAPSLLALGRVADGP